MNDDQGNETTEAEKLIAQAIDAAEDISDPLDGVVERSAADPSAAFSPEVLERLAVLKKDNRAAFESLRVRLKETGCRVARRGYR